MSKTQKLRELHGNTSHLRNICILAHVDHGKTTLADCLLANNGIISSRLAGKLRFMDSRPDEQQRGITMKTSAITIVHRLDQDERPYVINLVDSPGHVDFASEVSSAVRLCDGAIVVVDVVEGVSAQTHAVLRQAWLEQVKPVLVLNKIDRLILELQMTVEEAYVHLGHVLEQVNAITGSLFVEQTLNEQAETSASTGTGPGAADEAVDFEDTVFDWGVEVEEEDESLYFDPARGNVVFASALDSWGFSIPQFAEILSKKFKCNAAALRKTLWGDFYLSKDKSGVRIRRGAMKRAKTPMFVSCVLQNIWGMAHAVRAKDKDRVLKMGQAVGIKLTPRGLQQDERVLLRTIFSQWLPLSRVVLDMTCQHLPSPLEITPSCVEKLMYASRGRAAFPEATVALEAGFQACDPEAEQTIAFVSKISPVPSSALPENQAKPLTAEDMKRKRDLVLAKRRGESVDEEPTTPGPPAPDSAEDTTPNAPAPFRMLAYARVFCGTLRPGQELQLLAPKYSPRQPERFRTTGTVEKLFMLMGSELREMEAAPAGTIVGILGLAEPAGAGAGAGAEVYKSLTLATTCAAPSLARMGVDTRPIVRVALDTQDIRDMPRLKEGMRLLSQADTCAEVLLQETGELVLVAAGEVHIERCLADLRELYAPGVRINVSPPIIPFRETVIEPPTVDLANEAIGADNAIVVTAGRKFLLDADPCVEDGHVVVQTGNRRWRLHLRADPLPPPVVAVLDRRSALLRDLFGAGAAAREGEPDELGVDQELRAELREAFAGTDAMQGWEGAVRAFGPRHSGPNILRVTIPELEAPTAADPASEVEVELRRYFNSVDVAFQVMAQQGPLCEEPMRGVCFTVSKVELAVETDQDMTGFAGQLISCVKDGFRQAFLSQHVRLMTALFSCELVVSSSSLGKVYDVLNRRNGQITGEEMKEGSDNFLVSALIPVTDSFGFAEELRKRTSGLAVPQLVFSHWALVDKDPFWTPQTEEELLHFGDKADAPNTARRYMDDVRRRKGLPLEEKLVEFGEKQRTLGRNK